MPKRKFNDVEWSEERGLYLLLKEMNSKSFKNYERKFYNASPVPYKMCRPYIVRYLGENWNNTRGYWGLEEAINSAKRNMGIHYRLGRTLRTVVTHKHHPILLLFYLSDGTIVQQEIGGENETK